MTLKQKFTEVTNHEPHHKSIEHVLNANSLQKSGKALRSAYKMSENSISKVPVNQYDLYKQQPSVDYLKEKYEMYMEWLIEQAEKNDELEFQLNWYNYEKSINHKDKYSVKKNELSNSQNSQIDFNTKL